MVGERPDYQFHPVFHVSMLRPCYDNGYNEEQPPMIMIDSEECELSQILQHRPLKKQIRGLKHQISGQMDGICLQRREPESMIKHRAPDTLSNTGTKLLLNTQCKQLGLS